MKLAMFLVLILIIPLASAASITINKNQVNLTSRGLNSTITFSISANCTSIQVMSNSIYIFNVTTNGKTFCSINLTTKNSLLDSSSFCLSSGGGGGAGGVPQGIVPQQPKVIEISKEQLNGGLAIIIWLVALMIFLIISYLLDNHRREKHISSVKQGILTIISAVVLIAISLSSQFIIFNAKLNLFGYQFDFSDYETKILFGIITGIICLWFLILWLIVERSKYSKS